MCVVFVEVSLETGDTDVKLAVGDSLTLCDKKNSGQGRFMFSECTSVGERSRPQAKYHVQKSLDIFHRMPVRLTFYRTIIRGFNPRFHTTYIV